MCLTVMVTANHYWLDIVAGVAVAGVAVGVASALPWEAPGRLWRVRDRQRLPGPVVRSPNDAVSGRSRPPVVPPYVRGDD
jgi:hypothetical protein